jgi:TniQ
MNGFQKPSCPPRSRLYSLAPCNVETIWRESLTGYLNRLARTHHISPRALIADVILPRLGTPLPFPRITQLGTQGMGLNGPLAWAQAWAGVLEQETSRTDLHLLTLPWWIGDLSPWRQLRAAPAWCPLCLAAWRKQGHPIYQPLVWMFQIVTVCPRHQSFLVDRCPACQKGQKIITTNKTNPGDCTHCSAWLGAGTSSFACSGNLEPLMAWQAWVMHVLRELHDVSQVIGVLPWEPFFRQLASSLEQQRGYPKLARVTGMPRAILRRWGSGTTYRPTLEAILKLCYVCEVTPVQVMNGQLDRLQQIIEQGTDRHPPLPRRQNRRVDREQCQQALQAVLDRQAEPLGIAHIAKQLGYDTCQLVYHFSEECAVITQRVKEHRLRRKEQHLVRIREEVRQAVFSLHAQGLYPSQRRVRLLLPGRLLRDPEAKEAWRATLRELGFEP